MADLSKAEISVAGAYVSIQGLYLFALGSILQKGRIPVYRIGGHRQTGETAWECAARETFEETNLYIRPIDPGVTYLVEENHTEIELRAIEWPYRTPREPDPILVRAVQQQGKVSLSLMYLAQADELPVPCNEVKGLLLLNEANILALCQRMLTMGQYLQSGGKAIQKESFDPELVLEPFLQLRALSKLLPLLPRRSGTRIPITN